MDEKMVMIARMILILISVFYLGAVASAHPGIGLLYDGNEYIYYTDLQNIWKFNIRSGEKTILIPDVHTHEICMDTSYNIYGEHYWYISSNNTFKNYIWKFSAENGLKKIRSDQEGENNDFSFIRDKQFNAYLFQKRNEQYEIKKEVNGEASVLYSNDFKDIGWKYLSKDGKLYFISQQSLYSLSPEQNLKMIAEDLSANRIPFSFVVNDHHNIYGIWEDDKNNIYVAIYGGREVKMISPDNKVKKLIRTSFFWSPLNGVFDKDKNLWLLEANVRGKVRLRKIAKEELNNYNYRIDLLEYTIFLVGLGVLIYYSISRFRKYTVKNTSALLEKKHLESPTHVIKTQ